MNQRLVFVILLSPGHEIRRVQGAEALGSAAQHAPSVAQLVLGLFKHDPPLIQKDDVIRHLLQVAGDVRGDQHGVLLVLHEVPQQVQNIVSHHRVQPAGRFVQHQQPGPVRKRRDDGQLRARALGHLAQFLIRRHPQPLQQRGIPRFVPGGIDPAENAPQLRGRKHVGKVVPVKYHAHLPERFRVQRLFSQHAYRARIPFHQAQGRADQRALARAVFADQPHDRAARYVQGYVLQPKAGICLAKPPHRQCHFRHHGPS